jgi:hypothetical protein
VITLVFDERHRIKWTITEPGVDVPHAARVVVGGEVVDEQHEVIGERLGRWPFRPMHAANMMGDSIAEVFEEQRERAVEMKAVPASPADDSVKRRIRINCPDITRVNPQRLVRNVLQLRPLQSSQRCDRRWPPFHSQPTEIRIGLSCSDHPISLAAD